MLWILRSEGRRFAAPDVPPVTAAGVDIFVGKCITVFSIILYFYDDVTVKWLKY